jgi:hypothetical protein
MNHGYSHSHEKGKLQMHTQLERENMKTIFMCIIAIIVVIPSCCVTDTYTAKTGPFIVRVANDYEPVKFVDDFKSIAFKDFNSYIIYMWVGNDMFSINVDDYGYATDVSERALLNMAYLTHPELEKKDVAWLNVSIGGKQGIIGKVEVPGSIPRFEAIYSPDGNGNQGTIIVTVSAFSENKKKVEKVLKTIKISRVT